MDNILQNKPKLSRYNISIVLMGILLSAMILRLWGIDFGLPYIYHTDEWFEIKRALKLGAGIYDFDRVTKGGYFYLLFLEYGVYFTILKVFQIIKSSNDFLYNMFIDPTVIWLIGRVTTATIGTINCLFMFLMGKRAFSRNVGIIASLLMAINLRHVMSSHYVTVDVPLTCLITICFFLMVNESSGSILSKRRYALIGIFAAMSISTKISGAIILLPIAIFHYQNLKAENKINIKSYFFDRRFLFFIGFFIVIYLIGSPGIIIKFKEIFKWALSFLNPSATSSATFSNPVIPASQSKFSYYMSAIFPKNYLLLDLFIVGGIIIGVIKNRKNSYLFLSFILAYIFFLVSSKSQVHIFSRYILPVTPILCYYAALFMEYMRKKFLRDKMYGNALFIAVLIVVIYAPVNETIRFDIEKTKTDTRMLAKDWVEKNVPRNSVILLEGELVSASTMTVPLKLQSEMVDEILREYIGKDKKEGSKDKFYYLMKKALRDVSTHHLIFTYNRWQVADAFKKRNIEYAILRNDFLIAFSYEENKKRLPELYGLYRWITSEDFRLEKVFEPNEKVTGPKLIIYKKKI